MTSRSPVKGIELHDDQTVVDTVAGNVDFGKLAADEAFMNEHVTIMIHPTTDENQPNHVILNVNGVNQPVVRGVQTVVKRKYLEVLARMKETKYSQPQRDMSNPEYGNQVIGRTALVYPFDVLSDNNPKGRAWLHNIMAEPA